MTAISRCFVAVSILVLTALSATAGERLTVFAAASLKDVLEQAAEDWGQDVSFSFAGSGLIARQVTQGAPADMVILASADWMEWLTEQPLALSAPRNIASNRLVVVGPADAAAVQPAQILARLDGGRLAMGQREAVPAGIYARQWLERAGLWEGLRPHLAETENVRAALALVARGEAPLGVVYASDARADPSVSLLYKVPAEMHDPIVYPMAVLADSSAAAAGDFATFLTSPAGQVLFEVHGFVPLGASQ